MKHSGPIYKSLLSRLNLIFYVKCYVTYLPANILVDLLLTLYKVSCVSSLQ